MPILMQTTKTDYGRKSEAWYLLKELTVYTNSSGIEGCSHQVTAEMTSTLQCCQPTG